jgi:nitroreductase
MAISKNQENPRNPEFPVQDFIINRWSPRAMSGEALTREEIMPLFEAAKWAPSSYNGQPWRFLFALRDTPYWETYFNFLVKFNQSWAKNAGALILVLSKKTFEQNGKPAKTHSFDTGAAWENLALQGNSMGYVVHGMEGFDYDKSRKELDISDDYEIECMIAVGKPGDKENLPEDLRDEKPNERKSVDEIAFEGNFNGDKSGINNTRI